MDANELSFQEIEGRWESDVINFDEDAALELHFNPTPEYSGVEIFIFQSLSADNWQCCYHETLRAKENTFCKTVEGYSRKASYKVICSSEPEAAYYV